MTRRQHLLYFAPDTRHHRSAGKTFRGTRNDVNCVGETANAFFQILLLHTRQMNELEVSILRMSEWMVILSPRRVGEKILKQPFNS